ncbi:hypothetical protein B0H16DRAFT_416062 [Mycena metata]|uniref:HMG box domain-containing protein n=1 Tax=Mycena metata TaxID=1033252 RepID=A0AAD7JM08_9AGAR|nr:hypothetical protein B0H16DRAFT_416062 [Mycena metata]
MPAVHSIIPPRQSRRLRHTGPKDYQDDLWEAYDETLLTSVSPLDVKSEPTTVSLLVVKSEPTTVSLLVVKSEPTTVSLLDVKSEPTTAPVLFDVHIFPDPVESAHIPRPPNAFICFRSAYVKAQKEAAARSGSVNQTVMSCGAAIVWKNMNENEKFPYRLMAEDAKAAHTLKYPNYRYAPGSANGVARKPRKPRAPVRRASSVTSDDSDVPPRSYVSRSRPSRKYETNPPTARSTARTTSTLVTPPPRHVSPSPTPVPASPVPVPVAQPSEVSLVLVPQFTPETYTNNDDKLETVSGSLLAPRPLLVPRPDHQFGVKRSLSPMSVESATLPIPSESSLSTQAPPLDDFVAARSSRAPSPVAPFSPAPVEWDGWPYTPLELPEDEPLYFDAPVEDFGFYHAWDFDVSSSNLTPVVPRDDIFMF